MKKEQEDSMQKPVPNTVRNSYLHIPFDFEKAVTILSNAKPKKKPVQKTDEKQK
jgi:hypothetical protein